MKISTRQYLKDLEKAYRKGRGAGASEVYNDRDRRAAFDRFEANMCRLEERVEQLGRMVEEHKKASEPTCDSNPGGTFTF